MQPMREDSWPGRPSLTHGFPLGRGPTRVRSSPPRGCCRRRSEEDTGECRPSHAVLPPGRGPTRVRSCSCCTCPRRNSTRDEFIAEREARPLSFRFFPLCVSYGALRCGPLCGRAPGRRFLCARGSRRSELRRRQCRACVGEGAGPGVGRSACPLDETSNPADVATELSRGPTRLCLQDLSQLAVRALGTSWGPHAMRVVELRPRSAFLANGIERV